ncbi:MAG: ubiquinone/menaquinone biosynthesis methyltransferase [Deltaproteobacteria bacterium]|nr:ubiquinone/menaquinone biosynthesis methyltransferase [Deltaproteobacteria bacterium]
MEKRIDKAYPSVIEATEKERVGMVKEIFSTITPRYDFLNHFLSLRRDIAWRRFAINKMRFFKTKRFLDIACGTGDLSIDAARKHPEITVNGVDFVPEMIQVGREKVYQERLSFFQVFYNIYLNHILPRLARRFSSNPAAYRYLADSIMNFPTPDEFTALMEDVGIENVDAYSLTFGVTYLHVGMKGGKSETSG